MKKTILSIIICALLAFTSVIGIACGQKPCAHVFDQGEVVRQATCVKEGENQHKCIYCGAIWAESIAKVEHEYGDALKFDNNSHWKECVNCGEKSEITTHDFSTDMLYDDFNHYLMCECGAVNDQTEHAFVGDNCSCGYKKATTGLEFTLMQGALGYEVTGLGSYLGQEIIIPYSHNGKPVVSIGEYAFLDKDGIASVRIPRSITSIERGAFKDCSNLNSVVFDKYGQLKTLGSEAFSDCVSLQSITLPKSIQTTGFSAFFNCSKLERVDFDGESVLTIIGHEMFASCEALSSFEVPKYVRVIEEGAFFGCEALKTIVFKGKTSLKTISDNAFRECTSLEQIEIVESVTWIGAKAFYNCGKLQSIQYNAIECMNLSFDTLTFAGVGTDLLDGTKILVGVKVKRIPAYIFSCLDGYITPNVSEIEFLEKGVCEEIGVRAFSSLSNLTKIDFASDNTITAIGDYAFSGLRSLETLVLADGIKTLGTGAFENCDDLCSLTIPNSLTTIGAYAFSDCDLLQTLNVSDESQLSSIGSYAFFKCIALTNITIPQQVKIIETCAFLDCDGLVSVTFKNTNGWVVTGNIKINESQLSSGQIACQTLKDNVYNDWTRI